ncbi:pleckstrin homology-like domain family A member 1 [Vidua chalybeata]|nr:pleckstrin homology-like domain family A member 1 [Vidua chalybeata]
MATCKKPAEYRKVQKINVFIFKLVLKRPIVVNLIWKLRGTLPSAARPCCAVALGEGRGAGPGSLPPGSAAPAPPGGRPRRVSGCAPLAALGFPAAGGREEPLFPLGVTLGWERRVQKREGREKPADNPGRPHRQRPPLATPRHGRQPLRFLRAGALPSLRLGAGARRRVLGWCRLHPEPSPCGRRPSNPSRRMLESGCKAVKEGMLEKRSDGLLQLWKKKRCILTEEGLLLIPPKHPPPPQQQQPAPSAEPAAKIKELHFSNMKTVDCVERKGKYVYFTVVMAEGKEIDFRCAQEQGWNAAITLQMVQYKNRQAILAVRSTRQKQQHLAAPHGSRLRGTSNSA